MSTPGKSGALGQALVEFTANGAFPEEGISDLKLSSDQLPPAIQSLAQAKTNLEVCILQMPLFLLCSPSTDRGTSRIGRNPHHQHRNCPRRRHLARQRRLPPRRHTALASSRQRHPPPGQRACYLGRSDCQRRGQSLLPGGRARLQHTRARGARRHQRGQRRAVSGRPSML